MGSRFVSRLPCRERYQHYLHGEQNKRRTPQPVFGDVPRWAVSPPTWPDGPATAMRMTNLLGFVAW